MADADEVGAARKDALKAALQDLEMTPDERRGEIVKRLASVAAALDDSVSPHFGAFARAAVLASPT